MKKRLFYLILFIGATLFTTLTPFPAAAFGNEWVAYSYGTWGFDSRSHPGRWQEVIYQSQQRITTGWLSWFSNNGIRLYNTSTGSGFPLTFDSECTPDTGSTCNQNGDYIGHNGNTANPSPLPARDYYNNHDESWSWYRNADWAVDFRFRGNCTSGNCSGLGNNFLYAQTRENRTGFAVGANLYELKWFYTHDNSTAYFGSINSSAHTGRVERIWATWNMWLDGGNLRSYTARQTSPDTRGDRIMTNLNMGNLQQINARWPEVSLDYINVFYALPDAYYTSVTPASPLAPGTNVTVNTWVGDIRGTGSVTHYVNMATDGSASGAWTLFASKNAGGSKSYNDTSTLNCGSIANVCVSGHTHLLASNTYDVYGNRRQQWDIETRLQTTARWAAPPTPTPTSTPYVQVRIQNPAGGLISLANCAAGGSTSGNVQEHYSCVASSNRTIAATSLTDRLRMGVDITNLGGNVLVGVSGATAGGALNTWSNYQPNYSWSQWFTGGRAVTFIVASPTPTPTATPYVQVRIQNPGGSLISLTNCGAGGSTNGNVQEHYSCVASSNRTIAATSLTDRLRMGVDITNLGGNVLVGVSGATAGGVLNTWSNYQPNYSWSQWFTGGRAVTFIVASPTPTNTPTPTFTPTPTPTATPYVQVRIQNPGGGLVSLTNCGAGGSTNGNVQEHYSCVASSNRTIAATSLTDRLRMGVDITNLSGNVLVGVNGATAGGALNTWSNNQPNYSWSQWFTGGRTITFIVASPTPTRTPTPSPTPTVVITSEFHPAQVTPMAYIDTAGSGSIVNPTPPGGGPTPVPGGLSLSDFYYPLQVWLQMIPTIGVSQPAEWCLGMCYEADSRPISYTYLGMSRADGQLAATTPYTQSFSARPYEFTDEQYLDLFWEFPHIDDELGLNPPRYYYTEQVPGVVDFHYYVRLRHTWTAAQTAAWPAVMSPMPPCTGWGGPGQPCVFEEDINIGPAEALNLRMNLLRPVIERVE